MAKSEAVRADVNWSRIQREFENGTYPQAQKILDLQVLKDSTPYVPRDTGNLTQSGIRATDIGSGEVIWDAPYADEQYYGKPSKAKDVHPQAVMQWFEAAKAARKDAWMRVAKRAAVKGHEA